MIFFVGIGAIFYVFGGLVMFGLGIGVIEKWANIRTKTNQVIAAVLFAAFWPIVLPVVAGFALAKTSDD